MQNIELTIIIVLVVGIFMYLFLNKKKDKSEDKNDTGLNLILTQINELARTVDSKLGESQKQVNESLKFHSSESNKIIRDITQSLTKLDETNKQVISFADQLQSLENILKNPKQRGILGEYYLETVLKNVLTSKYIQPGNGTTDFAFMFIPHEAIYYDLITNKVGAGENNENLIQRAAGKYKVIITSPTSFLAYLQTVLQGLKALQIEESAKEIIKKVEDLGKHLKSYDEYHNKLGNSLTTVVNHYNASNKELKKIDKDVLRITGTSPELNLLEVEKISTEE